VRAQALPADQDDAYILGPGDSLSLRFLAATELSGPFNLLSDGTASLTAGRTDIFTLSLHAEKNFPVRKARSSRDVGLPDGVDDDGFMEALTRHLPEVFADFAPDFVLYQAGVDPHVDDKLGRLALTDAGLGLRDRYVVREARRRGLAIASALGGGYGDDPRQVAARHAASMLAMADENRQAAPPA